MLPRTKRVVVTHYQPWRKWAVLAISVVSLPLVAWGFYDYGRSVAGFDSLEAGRERRTLQGAIDDLKEGNDSLRQQLENLARAKEIDKQAYGEIDSSLESLQHEIAELKEEVAFYRRIAAPHESAQGVRIQNLQLSGNGKKHGYSYTLILVQTAKDASFTRGEVKIKVQGLVKQEQTEYSFTELSGQNAEGEKFRFKYFGKTEGNIILPAGFIPTRVMVHVTVESPKRSDVEAAYAWQEVTS